MKIEWRTGEPPEKGWYLVKRNLGANATALGLPHVRIAEWVVPISRAFLEDGETGYWCDEGNEPKAWFPVKEIV